MRIYSEKCNFKLINSKKSPIVISEKSFDELYNFYKSIKNVNEELRFVLFNLMACTIDKDATSIVFPVMPDNVNDRYLWLLKEMHQHTPISDNKIMLHIVDMVKFYEDQNLRNLSDDDLKKYSAYRTLHEHMTYGIDHVMNIIVKQPSYINSYGIDMIYDYIEENFSDLLEDYL